MGLFASPWNEASSGTGNRSWIRAVILLIVLSALFSFISDLQQPSQSSCAPPQCSLPPPKQGPLSATTRYTSSTYGFSVDYSTSHIAPSQKTGSSISWDGQLRDGSEVSWSLTGTPANGRSAQQIADSTQSSSYPDAQLAYTIPDASLGYRLGYGAVYDVTVSPADGSSQQDRLIVTAVIRHGLAVVLVGLGPYEASDPNSDSQPNPADTPLAELGDFEENINSVTWPGDQGF